MILVVKKLNTEVIHSHADRLSCRELIQWCITNKYTLIRRGTYKRQKICETRVNTLEAALLTILYVNYKSG
jgi:hypothetical protein